MNNPLYRPPAEANSFILQIDQGCPYNACTFCAMYKGVPYQKRNIDEIKDMLERDPINSEHVTRIFLADGDVMRRSFDELSQILDLLIAKFSNVRRINTYATGTSILSKTLEELKVLKKKKLKILYMGLESGDDNILKQVRKEETAEQMIEAGTRAQDAGLQMSVMVLLGLGGTKESLNHATNTAKVLNKMQPRLLSCLRIVPVPGTQLEKQEKAGEFEQVSEYGVIEELKQLVENLELNHTVFRANHSSNPVPIEARFPKDKEKLVLKLKALLESGALDKNSPGPLPLWL